MVTCTRATSPASASNSTKKPQPPTPTSRPTCPTTASSTAPSMTGDPAMTTEAQQAMTKPRIVVMGVSGCGKTTIGDLVARELGVRFLDGDSLHPVQNVAKMAAGTPLTDEDRWPWLATVGSALANAGTEGLVLA